jgi:pimeloyl-ACP methyl ester carboxylesterase
LIGDLGADARAYTKELELYTLSLPPDDYATADELDGLSRWARRAGLDRFHLYSHSGGGAVGLAFTAAHPERVLSLTLHEAAFDFSDEMRADLAEHRQLQRMMLEDPQQAMARFMRLELKPGIEFAPRREPPHRYPTGPPASPRSCGPSSATRSTPPPFAASEGACSTRAAR